MHGRLRIADAETEAALGKARGLLADAGRRSERNAGLCEAREIEPWISAGRQGHSRPLATVSEDRGSPPSDGGGADGLAHEVEGGPEDAFKTQVDSRADVRDIQGRDGFPAVLQARGRGRPLRTGPGAHFAELDEDARARELRGGRKAPDGGDRRGVPGENCAPASRTGFRRSRGPPENSGWIRHARAKRLVRKAGFRRSSAKPEIPPLAAQCSDRLVARSRGGAMRTRPTGRDRASRPSTLGIRIRPDVGNAQESKGAVSLRGGMVCAPIRQRNVSSRRCTAFLARAALRQGVEVEEAVQALLGRRLDHASDVRREPPLDQVGAFVAGRWRGSGAGCTVFPGEGSGALRPKREAARP